ncbi:MAG: alanine--tRNA ligase [Pseudomonadota bacterium]
MISSAEIRRRFIDYFAERDHEAVASSPLVPANDPTLLFTNAGMVQFKDVFLGAEKRAYTRAVTSQRCVRAGGKHNDLDEVGYTARHHTFFEMLGNFSFGDYFKKEAIEYAWEFLTDVLELPAERMLVTVYETDNDAFDLWTNGIGVPADRVLRIGDKPGGKPNESDNFWAMGDTGPCGPCSEIFYDHGPEIPGGPPGSEDEDGDRFIEVWNLVFMQFDRNAQGELKPLPSPCVDTGMGLERLAAILQHKHSNYETDTFQTLITAAARATGCDDLEHNSLKVIADHIRATSFLIVDGVLPSNEGRGYVLRRIIRRAIRHGYKLGQQQPFFAGLVGALDEEMGEAYPELRAKADFVRQVLATEESRFAETLDQGMRLLEGAIEGLETREIPGETAFKLYDTYGFPADLTADVARERGLTVDQAGFDTAMAAQRERARAASQFKSDDVVDGELLAALPVPEFLGYDTLTGVSAQITGLMKDGQSVPALEEGDQGFVFLSQTPFYAESGGQVGDEGQLHSAEAAFAVADTRKLGGVHHGHQGTVSRGRLEVGQVVTADVDADRRQAIVLNHSGTHLLHAALRTVLGDHVEQKGSLVAPERLRFDFSHFQPVSSEELAAIEQLVNRQIRANDRANVNLMDYDRALESGAMALFGEKYGDEVRVLRFGDFSVELCGGTHVDRVGDIGLLKIVSEGGIASGVRRIEAVTGDAALRWVESQEVALRRTAEILKGSVADVPEKVHQMVAKTRELEKALEAARASLASQAGGELSESAEDIDGVKVVAAQLDGVKPQDLRQMVDKLKDKLKTAAVVLAVTSGEKVQLAAGVTADTTDRLRAGDLVNHVASQVGGRGGGRPDMAQAGGNQPENLSSALASVSGWVKEKLTAVS